MSKITKEEAIKLAKKAQVVDWLKTPKKDKNK